jgi:hypothetical protein
MTDDGLKAVIGGVSYAEDVIMSTSPLSFITYFAGPMMSLQWHKVLDLNRAIAAIKFSTDDVNLIFITKPNTIMQYGNSN